MNPISWVQDLQGLTLVAVICGLLFVEEVGVPLPFAPGDVVLAIGGIAIAGGRVSPIMLVPAVMISSSLGALIGRDVFAWLGWQRLMKVANLLRARKPLEQASRLLERGGWRAVFTARLLPGLRVYTTQIAGASGVSRKTFISGLLPATVVYVSAFVGLGAAFGRPILALIGLAEHQALLAILLIAALVLLLVLTRAPLQRGLASLEAAGWTGPLRFSLDSVSIVLILACVGLNFAAHAVAVAFGLPLFLDSTGTVLAGLVAGPWIGGSVGVISNLISSNTIDPIAAPYALTSFAVGFLAGLARYLGWHRRPGGWLALWLTSFTVSAVISTPINFLMSGGKSGVAFGDSLYAGLAGLHLPTILAAFLGEAAIDLPDKLITVTVAILIVQGFPQQQPARSTVDLDLGEAFTFVFRSHHWRRRSMIAAVCVLFAVLIVPYLILQGYLLEVSRRQRAGQSELPPWNRLWTKLKDGFRAALAVLLWIVPGLLLSIPAGIIAALSEQPGFTVGGALNALANAVSDVGSVWVLLVLLLEPAILSEFLDHGIRGGLNLRRIIHRLRVNVGLSIVVGVLVLVLTTLGLLGLLGFLIGVAITLPYASFVTAYLVGYYARVTDPLVPAAPTPALVR